MTGGQLIVECLVRQGDNVVFGIPGAHTISIYDALHRHPKIKHILVRHEQSAALMADGYARSTGKPGVCFTGIAALQDVKYGGRREAVDLVNPDFVRFAESFGSLGLRVKTPDDFRPALERALQADRPALLEIVC